MNTTEIQIKIDELREQLKMQTATYKLAIKERESFETAKTLLGKRMETFKQISQLAEQYEHELRSEMAK